MKWGGILGVTFIVVIMVLWQWRSLGQNQKKERRAVVGLSFLGWALAVSLIHYPEMPGPTQLTDWLYKPMGRWLEK